MRKKLVFNFHFGELEGIGSALPRGHGQKRVGWQQDSSFVSVDEMNSLSKSSEVRTTEHKRLKTPAFHD